MRGISGRGLGAGSGTGSVVYKACGNTLSSFGEYRVEEEQPHSSFSFSFPSCSVHLRSVIMSKAPPTTDPTKMGIGRAIAVLTSGGDAQGRNKSLLQFGADELWASDRRPGELTTDAHPVFTQCIWPQNRAEIWTHITWTNQRVRAEVQRHEDS